MKENIKIHLIKLLNLSLSDNNGEASSAIIKATKFVKENNETYSSIFLDKKEKEQDIDINIISYQREIDLKNIEIYELKHEENVLYNWLRISTIINIILIILYIYY